MGQKSKIFLNAGEPKISELDIFHKLDKHYQIHILIVETPRTKKITRNIVVKKKTTEVKIIDVLSLECVIKK